MGRNTTTRGTAIIGALRTADDPPRCPLTLGALVLSAWVVLAAWGASPFAGLLSHGQLAEGGLTLFRVALFAAGWLIMSVAMMLPSSLPFVHLFHRLVAERPKRNALTQCLIVGYLAVWVGFGVVAFVGDAAVHAAVQRNTLVAAVAPWIGLTVLLGAGAYQLTPLKAMCLGRCRSPYTFRVEHRRGLEAGWEAVRLGGWHGLLCVGSCGTLMSLMFAVGGVNLGWMLGLAAVMALEKTSRWGQRLAVPVGVVLILCGLSLASVFIADKVTTGCGVVPFGSLDCLAGFPRQ